MPAAAAGTGTLFAITGPTQSELSRVDPGTGVVTPIEDLSGPSGQGQVVSITGDSSTHRLFLMRSTTTFIPPSTIIVVNQVLTVNSQTGAVLSSPDLSGLANGLQFDSSSGTLFGLSQTGVVRVDPTTGTVTPVVNLVGLGSFISILAVAPSTHTLYVSFEDVGFINPPSTQLFAVNSQTGAVISSTTLTQAIRFIVYDNSLGRLFGTTDSGPRNLAQISPASGSVTVIGPINGDILQSGPAIDSSTHTLFMDLETVTPITTEDHLVAMNDQTGASTSAPASGTIMYNFYFETSAGITAQSIEADVRSAFASGAITSPLVAKFLLAELAAAANARSLGHCGIASYYYRVFISTVRGQTGKTIAAPTASKLISEAQFLIANCP